MTAYKSKYLMTPDGVIEDGVITVEDGEITEVFSGPHDVDLGNVAVVPGIVNAHSHAFQRLIRGRTEYLQADRSDEDFWSWRTQMYAAAHDLDPAGIEIVSRMAFLEMALKGVTSVGEFHYVHHQPDGTPYSDPNQLAHRVIRAARDVGIRINLLRVAYHRGGYEKPVSAEQARFMDPEVDTYLERVSALSDAWAQDGQVSVGFAPHSIRAVPGSWLERIAQESEITGQVIHIHACEQRREIEESMAEYGKTPIAVFAERGLLGPRTTLVHATHLEENDLSLLERHGPTVCACPTTERNLGDGFLPANDLLARRIPLCLGSDSQAQINLWEDARLVEYHERLRYERRNVLAMNRGQWFTDSPPRMETADLLWPMMGAHGGRALALDTGRLLPGKPADFLVIDLDDVSLVGSTLETIKSDLVFSMDPRAVRDVYVDGKPIVTGGRHPAQIDMIEDFKDYVESH